jgi:hypothetical protein
MPVRTQTVAVDPQADRTPTQLADDIHEHMTGLIADRDIISAAAIPVATDGGRTIAVLLTVLWREDAG